MAASRLILIEGMIGSGKTTTAGHLRDWLSGRGEDVRAYEEGAADHPIRTRRVDELMAAPAPGDPDVYSAGQWRRGGHQLVHSPGPDGMFRGALIVGAHVFAAAGQPVPEVSGRGGLARADHALDQDQPAGGQGLGRGGDRHELVFAGRTDSHAGLLGRLAFQRL